MYFAIFHDLAKVHAFGIVINHVKVLGYAIAKLSRTFVTGEGLQQQATVRSSQVVSPADNLPMDIQPSAPSSPAGTSFSDRIQLLIDHVGSATQVARMCGFSEGVVRSWRDGNSDPSRARCVSLARAFNISLVWLITGEGPMQVAPPNSSSACNAGNVADGHASLAAASSQQQPVHDTGMDAPRLNTAVRILQSAFELSGRQLDLSENTDALIELYEMLGSGGGLASSSALVDFNLRLAERIKQRSQRPGDTAPKAA